MLRALPSRRTRGSRVEFGIFLQGHLPGPAAFDRDAEHAMFLREVEYVEAADRNGWKYVWVSEHHALTEYSHTSASEVFMAYCAARTSRIHLSSGIFNLSPRVNHPVRNAERVAMLDHLSEGRFEFGTGRGAGSHEVATFNILDTSSTRSEWDEVVRELPRMWAQHDYTFEGQHFTVPTPHNVLPKPYGAAHPPIWVACGNPPTFEKAGKLGIGAIGFNFTTIHAMQPMIDAYKEGIAGCTEPIGEFVNDNVMLTNAVLCYDDRDKARRLALDARRGYLPSLVQLYHDTFPHNPDRPTWPEIPQALPEEYLDRVTSTGLMLCGNPEEVVEQLGHYERTGVDQVCFGLPGNLRHDDVLELIETFGQHVIPHYDKDPVHSTTHHRAQAVPRFPAFTTDPPVITTQYAPG
jgi:alkanesulfonate monooxygenase SsuD/methylene tetrahydromethanopterin reductase-like flavin-dependent oxidoreductase (luciferase family)